MMDKHTTPITKEVEGRVQRVLQSDMTTYEIAKRLDYRSPARITQLREDITMLDRFTYKHVRGLLEIESEMSDDE